MQWTGALPAAALALWGARAGAETPEPSVRLCADVGCEEWRSPDLVDLFQLELARFGAPPVRPGWTVGVDLSSQGWDPFGFGVEARVGYQFGRGSVWLRPELLIGFLGVWPWIYFEPVGRGGLGARAGVRLWRLEPAVFAHVGGWGRPGTGGPGFDAGFALDVRISSGTAVGAQCALNRAWQYRDGYSNVDKVEYWSWGVHFDLTP